MNKLISLIISMIILFNFSATISSLEYSISILDSSDTLYVGGSGPGNYSTIQLAIDDANDGDTVFVYNGTYHENIFIYKSINLIGENRYNTTIDGDTGGSIYHIMDISNSSVTIKNFTIQNADQAHWTGGIKIHGASLRDINVYECEIRNNSNAILLDFDFLSNVSINNCHIYENAGSSISFNPDTPSSNCNNITIQKGILHNNGCGIVIYSTGIIPNSNIQILGCEVYSNSGDAISLHVTNDIKIENNEFYDNTGFGFHGFNVKNFVFQNNLVSNNTFSGLLAFGSSDNFSNISIHKNDITKNGKVIESSGSGIIISGCKNNSVNISENIVDLNLETGIEISKTSGAIIKNNVISYNSDDGILIEDSSNNEIFGNIIDGNRNGINFRGKSNNSNIFENNIENNHYGIDLFGNYYGNVVYHNNFVNNDQNALCLGYNQWYNAGIEEGNYWDNYDGIDIFPRDGIGDKPYRIHGGPSLDEYPLMKPYGKSKSIRNNLIDEPQNQIFNQQYQKIISLLRNFRLFIDRLLQTFG